MNAEKRIKHIRFPLLILALAGMVLAVTGITAARYLMEKNRQGIVETKNFYFTSDLLKEEAENAMYFIDPSAANFQVKLYNFADSLRITPESIDYAVTIGINDTGKSEGSSTPNSGTLTAADAGQADANLTITPAADSTSVTVTVASTAPFNKVLQATFKRELGNQYIVEDEAGNQAAVLTMVCADSAKTITVTLPDSVIPDATDSRILSYSSNICKFQSPGEGVYSLILLKSNPGSILKTADGSTEGKFSDQIAITQ